MSEERLQKILARSGVASRRKAEELIREGRVTINGRVAGLGDKADLERDAVKLDAKRIQAPAGHRYLLLNKPRGVMSTLSDPAGRPTVIDLVPPAMRRALVPVGRLDFQTEGLLLLTDDGELAQHVAHPSHGCWKTYEVKVRGRPDDEQIDRLRDGVVLEGRRTAPCRIKPLRRPAPSGGRRHAAKARAAAAAAGGRRRGAGRSAGIESAAAGESGGDTSSWWSVELGEGRTRQIREMFQRIGHPVQKLRRIAIGPVTDAVIPVGALRELTDREVAALRRSGPPADAEKLAARAERRKHAQERKQAQEKISARPSRGGPAVSRAGRQGTSETGAARGEGGERFDALEQAEPVPSGWSPGWDWDALDDDPDEKELAAGPGQPQDEDVAGAEASSGFAGGGSGTSRAGGPETMPSTGVSTGLRGARWSSRPTADDLNFRPGRRPGSGSAAGRRPLRAGGGQPSDSRPGGRPKGAGSSRSGSGRGSGDRSGTGSGGALGSVPEGRGGPGSRPGSRAPRFEGATRGAGRAVTRPEGGPGRAATGGRTASRPGSRAAGAGGRPGAAGGSRSTGVRPAPRPAAGRSSSRPTSERTGRPATTRPGGPPRASASGRPGSRPGSGRPTDGGPRRSGGGATSGRPSSGSSRAGARPGGPGRGATGRPGDRGGKRPSGGGKRPSGGGGGRRP